MSKPKRLNDIALKIALKTGVSEEDVIKLITCFYDDWVSSNLESFDNSFYVIEHLGTFSFRKGKYDKILKVMNNTEKFYSNELEKEKTRENKTFPKLVSVWNNNLEKVKELNLKVQNLKVRIKETTDIEIERYNEKIKTYESK